MSDTESEFEDEEGAPIIIDLGSHHLKCGFAYDEDPTIIVPTVLGRPKNTNVMVGMATRDSFVGNEAINRRNLLSLQYPIKNGIIENWDDFETILQHILYKLSGDSPVLLADKVPYPNNTSDNKDRERMTQIMFETFDVPKFYINYQSVFALYACGKLNAITIDCGYETTYCIPISNGMVNDKQYIMSSNVGGKQVTDYLKTLMTEKNIWQFQNENDDITEQIKKKFCQISINKLRDEMYASYLFTGYLKSNGALNQNEGLPMDIITLCDKYSDGEQYELPDGSKIFITRSVRTDPVECLFKPDQNGMHKLCNEVMNKMKDDGYDEGINDILLFGGNAMIENIDKRFKKEMKRMDKDVNIITPKNWNISSKDIPEFYAWNGASKLISLSSFCNFWVTKQEYDEDGQNAVRRKCDKCSILDWN